MNSSLYPCFRSDLASYSHLLRLWSDNPEVTTTRPTLDDDRSLRSSCIHYVLMLCFGSLLKGGLNIPEFPIWTPLPREGRTKDVMQVLLIKHVWLFMEYMPTLYRWTGASVVSPLVITVSWWISSKKSPIQCLRIYPYLFCYVTIAIITVTLATNYCYHCYC